MKKILLFVLLLMPFLSRADHGAGIDLFYTYLRGDTYRVTMIIYGNCTDRTDYEKLFTLNPQIDVIDNTVRKATLSLNIANDSTKDASPYCKSQSQITSCTVPSSSIQGFTRIYYTDTITLPNKSTKWIFRFNGSLKSGCGNRLGRPGALSNYTIPSSNNFTVDATLDNTISNNSSPLSFFATIPLYCVNVPSVYSQQTTDPDQDSLVYEVMTPKYTINCVSIFNLTARTGFSPLHVVPNSYAFNTNTGRMTFIPDVTQISDVAIRISEYRNGRLVGTVERDRIFKVQANCTNVPPYSPIDTNSSALIGASIVGEDSLLACPGKIIGFQIPITNTLGDTVKVTVENVLSGSNVIVKDNNSPKPAINFQWNTIGVANGVYTFYIRYETSSCPLSNTSLAKYTIIIRDAGDIVATTIAPTNCVNKATVKFDITNATKPSNIDLSLNGAHLKNYTDTTGTITDSLAPGDYSLVLSSPNSPCSKNYSFSVKDGGQYPYPPIAGDTPINYCLNFDLPIMLMAKADSDATIHWYAPSGDLLSGAPVPPTDKSGTYYYTVNQTYKTCESLRDTIQVNIDQDECDYAPKVYNVITPNGDGKNDKWIIEKLFYYPKSVVQVYNKAGNKVFERTNYQNDWTGDDLPSGVYYYLIRLNDVNKTNGVDLFKGYLMIKR